MQVAPKQLGLLSRRFWGCELLARSFQWASRVQAGPKVGPMVPALGSKASAAWGKKPAQTPSVHGVPRDSRPRDITRPQLRAPGWTPSRPGLLRLGPLAPDPLLSHKGSSRQRHSRPRGGDPPPVRTFSRDASMAEPDGGPAVPGATSASRAGPPFPRWQR